MNYEQEESRQLRKYTKTTYNRLLFSPQAYPSQENAPRKRNNNDVIQNIHETVGAAGGCVRMGLTGMRKARRSRLGRNVDDPLGLLAAGAKRETVTWKRLDARGQRDSTAPSQAGPPPFLAGATSARDRHINDGPATMDLRLHQFILTPHKALTWAPSNPSRSSSTAKNTQQSGPKAGDPNRS